MLIGLAQSLLSPDYRSVGETWIGGKTVSFLGIYLPLPQLVGGIASLLTFFLIWVLINRTNFGKALEATREDSGAVSLVGINKDVVFTFGWGLGAALVGVAGSVIAIFFYVYPSVGVSFVLTAFVVVALGGFGSVYGALVAGIIVGLVEAGTAVILSPALKSLGVFGMYLLVVMFRPRGLFGSM